MKPTADIHEYQLRTTLPAGYIHAYAADCTVDEEGIESVTVKDWNTEETLFTSTDGSGDSRGYPANIHAALQDYMAERYAVLDEPDNFPEGMTWNDMAQMYAVDMEDQPELSAQQFVLRRHDPDTDRYTDGPEANANPAYQFHFSGWVPCMDPDYEPDLEAVREALQQAIT